jgi:hypothetical protein
MKMEELAAANRASLCLEPANGAFFFGFFHHSTFSKECTQVENSSRF